MEWKGASDCVPEISSEICVMEHWIGARGLNGSEIAKRLAYLVVLSVDSITGDDHVKLRHMQDSGVPRIRLAHLDSLHLVPFEFKNPTHR